MEDATTESVSGTRSRTPTMATSGVCEAVDGLFAEVLDVLAEGGMQVSLV